jgi:tripartite-type tricarboxylate transporter receptor subunit TctC
MTADFIARMIRSLYPPYTVRVQNRRAALRLARVMTVALCASLQFIASVFAQEWPARPVTVVIPFAAGGPIDTIGRVLASHLSELLGQQIIVENIGGAGGMTGASRVAKAAPDGYQFVLGNVGTHAGNQTFYKNPLYNAVTDFTPVILVAQMPLVLVARKDFPANGLSEFIAHAKAHHANLQYGSGGAGSATHLACALLNAAIGIDSTHVPYRGGAPAMQDLIASRIDYLCIDTPVAIPQIESRTVKPIAVLTRSRSPSLPGLASAHEQGLVDFEASNWTAVFLPKGTPAAIVEKLHHAAVAAMETPSMQMQMKKIGADLVGPERRSSIYLHHFVETEIEKWAGPIKASGIGGD